MHIPLVQHMTKAWRHDNPLKWCFVLFPRQFVTPIDKVSCEMTVSKNMGLLLWWLGIVWWINLWLTTFKAMVTTDKLLTCGCPLFCSINHGVQNRLIKALTQYRNLRIYLRFLYNTNHLIKSNFFLQLFRF